LETGRGEIRVGEVAAGDGTGITGNVVSGVGSSVQRWTTPFRSAMKTQEPKNERGAFVELGDDGSAE